VASKTPLMCIGRVSETADLASDSGDAATKISA
jgi:hypothetical protein